MKKKVLSLAFASAFVAAPVSSAGPSENANCVAQFTTTAAAAHAAGPTISAGAHLLQPFGQNVVTVQAHGPRDACPFTFPP